MALWVMVAASPGATQGIKREEHTYHLLILTVRQTSIRVVASLMGQFTAASVAASVAEPALVAVQSAVSPCTQMKEI